MKYLHESSIITHCNIGKPIEQFLGDNWEDEFRIFEWISIEKNKSTFILTHHRVFDDRDEDCNDIYYFSYVEPDETNGTQVLISEDITEILQFARIKYNSRNDLYLPFGYLNEVIQSLDK